MKIKGVRLQLIPIKESDIEKIRVWRNTNRESFFDDKEISEEAQIKWYKRYTQIPPGTDLIFIAKNMASGEDVGMIALYDVDIDTRTAYIGRVLILQKHRGQDYGQEMVDLIRDFAFDTMRLHRLVVETDLLNGKAQTIYHVSGFKTIGQRFLPVTAFLFRIIVILEMINPDHDLRKPIRLESVEE